MVALPTFEDPTLEAMKAAYVAINVQQTRDYLGASLIGNECPRQIWYEYMKYPKKPFSAETLWNFEDGHRVEDIIAARLRLIPGIELWTHKDDGTQYGFQAFGGKFRGHFDGVIRGILQAPKALHVWECKSPGQKKWNEFQAAKLKFGEKKTLENWNYNYFVQAQLYMHYTQIDRHYMTVALAGAREVDSCRTEYDPLIAEKYINRADDILRAAHPPEKISKKPDYWVCRFCNFSKACHGEG